MNIKQIEEEFQKIFDLMPLPMWYQMNKQEQDKLIEFWKINLSPSIKQFYALKITELLNSLKMEEWTENTNYETAGWNEAVRELNEKIDGIIK